MASLTIKVTVDGSSREYLFNKLGPITIGSDEKCDLVLEDSHIEPKLMEVKVSGGRLFIKETGSRAEIYLDSVILPYREEVPYQEGKTINLKNTHYQIQIFKAEPEAHEPPPFFDEEFKMKLDKMNARIKFHEEELKVLEENIDKKKSSLTEMEEKYRSEMDETSRLNREIDSLRFKKDELHVELQKKAELSQSEDEKLTLIQDHIKRLTEEDRNLNESLLRQNLLLGRLKDEVESRHLEIGKQKDTLAALELEEVKHKSLLDTLKEEEKNLEREIQSEGHKMQGLLVDSDQALKDKYRINEAINKLLREKEEVSQEVERSRELLKRTDGQRKDTEGKLQQLKAKILKEEEQLKKLKDSYQEQVGVEKNLKTLNEDLRLELIKIEDRLTSKKNQFNQLDFQNQDALKKLSEIKLEIDRSSSQLKNFTMEEKSQELKLMGLKKEMQIFVERVEEDKKRMLQDFDDEKSKNKDELKQQKSEITNLLLEIKNLDEKLILTREQHDDFLRKNKHLLKERSDLEFKISTLEIQRSDLEQDCSGLKEQYTSLNQEKLLVEKELSALKLKLLDSEALIKEKEKEAYLEIEKYKAEERAKMMAEKNLMISEVEAHKQKSLIEVDAEYRRRLDELHEENLSIQKKATKVLSDAHAEAEIVLEKARSVETQTSMEASQRLKLASEEAHAREVKAHQRFEEAQIYFKAKEDAAHLLLMTAKKDAQSILQKAEIELQEDFAKRKKKMKDYLALKQEKGLLFLKNLQDIQVSRMQKEEERTREKLEHVKRKELKKVAEIRNNELSRHKDLKESILKEAKEEKEKTQIQIAASKRRQEEELAETKKTVLEHLNQMKVRSQKTWEEELQREKVMFENTKRQRVSNATQAVMNILITEGGSTSVIPEGMKEKIQSSIEIAINGGQSAETMKKVEQILDFNPLKKKEVLPVLKKYTVRVGIPAAVALILLADVGSVRTHMVDYSKELIKQKNSASDIFVKNQQEEWKQKYTFRPETTVGYKDTFTDNVLYTTDYMAVMESEPFQNQWILELHDFIVKELELSEDVAINYISSEGALIKELETIKKDIHPQFKDQGIKKLQDLEKSMMAWIPEKVSDPEKLQKFSNFRKDFFNKYYQEKFLPGRELASEKKVQP